MKFKKLKFKKRKVIKPEREKLSLKDGQVFTRKQKNSGSGGEGNAGYWLSVLPQFGVIIFITVAMVAFTNRAKDKQFEEMNLSVNGTPTEIMSVADLANMMVRRTSTAIYELTETARPTATKTPFPSLTPSPVYPGELADRGGVATKTSLPFVTVVPSPTVEYSETGYELVGDTSRDAQDFHVDQIATARYSFYWPPLGGVNTNGDDYMANGEPWQSYVGYALACPPEFPFGTKIRLIGQVYECMDRGGSITRLDDGTFWLDFLEEDQRWPFWTLIEVAIDYP